MPDIGAVFFDLFRFDPDRHRTNHLLKVAGYAEMIARAEGMAGDDVEWMRVAAILHDIGIKPSLEKFSSPAGQYQQAEGPPLARSLLDKYGLPAGRIDRVCYLIAHHHEYDAIDGLDYQILVEADFLVNCDESGMGRDEILSIRKKIFKTKAGSELFEKLFHL